MKSATQPCATRPRGWREEAHRLFERLQIARRALKMRRCGPRVVRGRMEQYMNCLLTRPRAA